MTLVLPVAGSTSTSAMWVEKPPSAPAVLSWVVAPIGPPVYDALAAICFSDSGSNLPALSPAGRA